MEFTLVSEFQPTGDQPEAINQLVEGLERGDRYQTLLGVTGSGKTFTMANVLARINRPALVLSHNKTLAAQLYSEFKSFFPNNAVEYFVSYYDYYQPEAYLPVTDTYIEKDLSINSEIEKLRLSATSALLSGRNDVVVVSSVSCIYVLATLKIFTTRYGLSGGNCWEGIFYGGWWTAHLTQRNGVCQRNFQGERRYGGCVCAYGDFAYRIIFW